MKAELIDFLGDDLRVVNAARVSFNKESEWDVVYEPESYDPYIKIKEMNLSAKDQKLIKYLADHNHWSPFSHVVITMREKVPIFVARQRFKHRIGFEYNEVSRRYVGDPPEFFVPSSWRGKPENAKQGSSDTEVRLLDWNFDRDIKVGSPSSVSKSYSEFIEHAERLYEVMIGSGVAPEQARMVLPQSMYTEYICTGSLVAWARAYKLRSDSHSQKEIQDLAEQWNQVISGIKEIEYSWKALTE